MVEVLRTNKGPKVGLVLRCLVGGDKFPKNCFTIWYHINLTRSYAALRAADLDWIVGPGYSSGRYILEKNHEKPWRTNLEPWKPTWNHEKRPGTMKNSPQTWKSPPRRWKSPPRCWKSPPRHENLPPDVIWDRWTKWSFFVTHRQTDKQNLPIIYRFSRELRWMRIWEIPFYSSSNRLSPTPESSLPTYMAVKRLFLLV